MCGNALVESNNMARSFLENKNQNYSHCPLKKRPLAYFLQQSVTETENTPVAPSIADEPEDLSVKSENRSASTYRDHRRLRALLEAAEIYSPPPAHQPVTSRSPVQHQHKQQQHMIAETKLSGKLEPLSVSAARESPNIFSTTSLPSTVLAPYHPTYPPYLPFNFPFPSYVVQPGVPHYPVTPLRHSPSRHEQLSPFAPRDSHSPSVTSTSRVFSADAPEAAASFIKHTDIDVEDLSSAAMSPDSESSTTTTSSSSKRRKISSSARFHCPDCQKSYSTYCGLTKHQELHCAQQSKKSFSCKHCDKVYVSLGALKMHIRTHTLPCKCTVCGKAFSRPWLLQGHIRTHTGEKPFSCQHCSRSFADRSNLRAHLQTHSDVKRYSCKGCDKTFSRMSLLSKHEASGCPQGSISKRDMA